MAKLKTRQLWFLFLLLVIVAAGMLVASIPIMSPTLPSVDPATISWTTYTDPELGFSIDHPDAYVIEADAQSNEVAFVLDGWRLVTISHLTKQQADERGLWADHKPESQIELGGRAGHEYRYNHFDILAGVQTISYVVLHRDKYLAVEYRLRKASVLEELGIQLAEPRQLGVIERGMLQSFRWQD